MSNFLSNIFSIDWWKSLFGFHVEAPTPTPSSQRNVWTFQYSPGMPQNFSNTFTFPTKDGVHYVVRPTNPPAMGMAIMLQFRVTGTGKLVATQGDQPARVRLYMQRRGDNLTAEEPNKRWWSDPLDLVVDGQDYQLRATISPENWINVNGQKGNDPAVPPGAFLECIQNLQNWGFTFGGMFAGHGVFATTADVKFTVVSFQVSGFTVPVAPFPQPKH